ncbi:bestrophin family ion channel [Crenobacter sp. SG2303]|uniref:Bestrophin family ion channel n=1 Tax=Crenobacter oryzisoli TaxID=3056844 RepID=A0ABT7XII0_9NEIS|nr:bestrophin family ion channel [Crenobacter sp. SG2303]MDN0073538.1 bestrophin family ion channel [Crenobacter sp. SG2303]
MVRQGLNNFRHDDIFIGNTPSNMIIRSEKNWLKLLFVWNGSVLRLIVPQLIFMFAVGIVALMTDGRIFGEKVPLNTIPFTLAGVALAIFLAFRNNASYDRYWEGRKLWGHILVSTRNLASLRLSCSDVGEDEKDLFLNRIIAFPYALKHMLRNTDASNDLVMLLGEEEEKGLRAINNKPMAILDRLRKSLFSLHNQGGASDTQVWLIDNQLSQLSEMSGGCERIFSTPIPFAYSVLLHRTVYGYCLLLPFGLVDSIGAATPIISVFISYTLLALEAIASDIADPFSRNQNGLPLSSISRTIERNVRELNGQAIPDPIRPNKKFELV